MSEVLSDRSNVVDMVNHPPHYASIVPGVECIEVARQYPFNCGNAIKYIWRAGSKGEEGFEVKQKEIEDLKKAVFYLNNELNRDDLLWKEKWYQKFGHVTACEAGLVLDHFTGNRRDALEPLLAIATTYSPLKKSYITNQIELARDAVQREINRLENVD